MSMLLMVQAMRAKVGNPLRKLVLIKLADNANDQGECWPSYQHIADQCEISRTTVKVHIRKLEAAGFLRREFRKNGEINQSNIFHLTIDSGALDALGGRAATALGGAAYALGGGAADAPRTSHSLEPVIEPYISSSNDEAKALKESSFEKFWSAYDKKVGKSVCEKKFMKLKDCDIEKILLVVGDYVKSTPDAKYRKNPQTWLNQECWNDEIINQSSGAWNEEVNARTYESGMSSAQRKILAARQLRDAAQGRSPMGFNGEFVHGQMDTQERRSAIIDMDGGNFGA